jgi:recombination protein RecA
MSSAPCDSSLITHHSSPCHVQDPRILALLIEADRRWGRGALVRWGDAVDPADVEVIPTGFADLDEALGVGGLPCGRISEIFGPDSSGKQALVASLVVQCQRMEGVAAWIDPARRLDPEQMKVQGVELDSLLVARPENELQALEMAIRLARSGGVKLLVFDLGVGGQGSGYRSGRGDTETRRHGEETYPPSRYAVLNPQSSALSTPHSAMGLALRRLVAAVDKNRIAFVFISNSHLSPILHPPAQSSVHSSRSSTGGQALRYFASVRLEMERREWIRRGREVVGCMSAVRVVKNKLAPPLREAEMKMLFYRFPPEPSRLAAIAR